jgi:hypothetical protein
MTVKHSPFDLALVNFQLQQFRFFKVGPWHVIRWLSRYTAAVSLSVAIFPEHGHCDTQGDFCHAL